MRVLLVKLSSLGDVIHSLPAAVDVQNAHPQVRIDWVVEPAFAGLLRASSCVERIIECPLRAWVKAKWNAQVGAQIQAFFHELRRERYDWIIDLQGLTKSALISRLARLNTGGHRVAMANRTQGSSYEAPTRWVSDMPIVLSTRLGALERSRALCAKAMGYEHAPGIDFGLGSWSGIQNDFNGRGTIALIHGSSRQDKTWPLAHWIVLAKSLLAQNFDVALVHGNDMELQVCLRIAQEVPQATVWPRLSLEALMVSLKSCVASIGVDSGPSHLCVALGLPHVQIYNHETAWRTGPEGSLKQVSVFAQPTPSVQEVQFAWQGVMRECHSFTSAQAS